MATASIAKRPALRWRPMKRRPKKRRRSTARSDGADRQSDGATPSLDQHPRQRGAAPKARRSEEGARIPRGGGPLTTNVLDRALIQSEILCGNFHSEKGAAKKHGAY